MSSNISSLETPKYFFRSAKVRNYGIPLFFSIMALHGGGHLELKKMHKGDFWGIFGIRLGRCPCIIPEKISFLQFYSRFNPNALALVGLVQTSEAASVLHNVFRSPAESQHGVVSQAHKTTRPGIPPMLDRCLSRWPRI